METIKATYKGQKIYLLQESGDFENRTPLMEFVKKNRNRVEKGKGFTRYLIMPSKAAETNKKEQQAPIEYFYLETPNVPDNYFPIHIYGIYDRVTIEEIKLGRLKEDIIKILTETKKFGIYSSEEKQTTKHAINWFTDKMYCPTCNITYPEFTTQHFSPNRPE